jgi:hypothetical protein
VVLIEECLLLLKEALLQKKGVRVATMETEINFTDKEFLQLSKLLHEAYQEVRYSPVEVLPLLALTVLYINSK